MMLVRVLLLIVVAVTSDVTFSAAEPLDYQQQQRHTRQDVPSYTLPPTRDVDMSAAGELFVLHWSQDTVSLYRPDAAAGFRRQWTRPTPAAPVREEWSWIYAAGDSRALLHALQTETVLLDPQGREAGRWQVKDRFLVTASSSRVVYLEGSYPNYNLHVYSMTDHSRRLFSLRSAEDGGTWGNPYVSIGPDGRYFVVDFRTEQLAAFSPTGERLYQQQYDYHPWRSPAASPDYVYVIDYLQREIHVHGAGTGAAECVLTAERLQLQDQELIYSVWAGQADTLYLRVEDQNHKYRIIVVTRVHCKWTQ